MEGRSLVDKRPSGPFIVIEGADGTGKSTLAEAMQHRGFALTHCGPPEQYPFDWWLKQISVPDGKHVFDRLHVGSFAYGWPFRTEDDMSPKERWIFDGILEAIGTMMVFANIPESTRTRIIDRKPDNSDAAIYEQAEYQQAVRDCFEVYFRSTVNVGHQRNRVTMFESYDWTEDGDRVFFFAEDLIATTLRSWSGVPFVPDWYPALGNIRDPKYIIVDSEQHSNMVMYDEGEQNAVEFFRRALAMTGWSFNDYCIVPAKHNGTGLNAQLVPKDAEVIAVGSEAALCLLETDIKFREIADYAQVAYNDFKMGTRYYPKLLTGEKR